MEPGAAETLFASLGPVAVEEMTGSWQGRAVATGHPVDELLRASSWWGKEFLPGGAAHPLVHEGIRGRYRLNPGLVPLATARRLRLARLPSARAAFRIAGPLFATRRPGARLRLVDDRGTLTAAMIYDQLPIVDIFRKAGDGTVFGRMDERGQPPAFFVLTRE